MKLNYNFVIQKVGDSYVAVTCSDSEMMFSGMLRMNHSAKYIFDLLVKGANNEKEIVDRIVDDFGLPALDASNYVSYFLNEMIKEGILDCD